MRCGSPALRGGVAAAAGKENREAVLVVLHQDQQDGTTPAAGSPQGGKWRQRSDARAVAPVGGAVCLTSGEVRLTEGLLLGLCMRRIGC
jgi:hypothetical protein